MELMERYKSLNHSLRYLKVQVVASLPYAYNKCPKFKTPEEIFRWLKLRTKYKSDPKAGEIVNGTKYKADTELFQCLPTLFENNVHGHTGYGDCDCFTIAALALLVANGFDNCGIVLVGRNKDKAVHIYAYVIYNGKKEFFDLTNKYYNFERSYPYKQSIPLVLTQKEKNTMYLQLAEGGSKHKGKMLYLPNSRAYVRESHLDNYHVNDFANLLGENGFSVDEISELSGKRAERKSAKKSAGPNRHTRKKNEKEVKKKTKNTDKADKRKAKTAKKLSKADINKAKAQKKLLVGQAKVNKAQGGGDGEEGEDKVSKFSRIFNAAGDTVGSVVKKFKGGGGDDSGSDSPDDSDSPSASESGKTKKKAQKDDSEGMFSGSFDIMGMEIPKPVAYLGGAAAAFGLYKLATHKSASR